MDRPIKRSPSCAANGCQSLFENSTRTRVSFELAEDAFCRCGHWSVSACHAKGETMRDTAWTLEAMGADIVVMRHGAVGSAQYLASS